MQFKKVRFYDGRIEKICFTDDSSYKCRAMDQSTTGYATKKGLLEHYCGTKETDQNRRKEST